MKSVWYFVKITVYVCAFGILLYCVRTFFSTVETDKVEEGFRVDALETDLHFAPFPKLPIYFALVFLRKDMNNTSQTPEPFLQSLQVCEQQSAKSYLAEASNSGLHPKVTCRRSLI